MLDRLKNTVSKPVVEEKSLSRQRRRAKERARVKALRRMVTEKDVRPSVWRTGGRAPAYGKRIIRTIILAGREHQLHATKGWRSRRHTPAKGV